MRKQLCDALLLRADDPKVVFLTGDLGFMALEPLQQRMGDRFINAGVAEQNMVSVAAALARESLETWVYSIAPFCYARPFEQIRNDIAFHGLPVKLIGNGGGYGYGVMGPTHHAIEDYGVLLTLPGMRVFVPAFDEDVATVVQAAAECQQLCYLRMGRGEPPPDWDVPAYAPWRRLVEGRSGTVILGVGPLVGTYIAPLLALPADARPDLWVLTELPLDDAPLPATLIDALQDAACVMVVEEHVRQGSFASQLLLLLADAGIPVRQFRHLHARAHNYGRYGSQPYLRLRSALDPDTLIARLGA